MMEMYTEMADHILIGKVIRRFNTESGIIVKVQWIDKIRNKTDLKAGWEDEWIIVADNHYHMPYIYYGPIECRYIKQVYEIGRNVTKQIVFMAAGRKIYTNKNSVKVVNADALDLELYNDKIRQLKEEQTFKPAEPKPFQKKKVVIVRKKPIIAPKKKVVVKVKTATIAAIVL